MVTTNCPPPSMVEVQTCRHGAYSRHDRNMHRIEYAAEAPQHRFGGTLRHLGTNRSLSQTRYGLEFDWRALRFSVFA
jgi:hypothetical protein